MPRWTPEPFWEGQDVFVIGGGPSLVSFDWNLIRGRCTIGCNSAYKLGKDVCQICFFGDQGFWREHSKALQSYEGLLVTNSRQFQGTSPEWLFVVPRKGEGAHKDSPGWYGNSGVSAVHLALLLGAKRVLMLGFDMKLVANRTNWYRDPGAKGPAPYRRFIEAFRRFARQYPSAFPGREVINVNDDSDLDAFPKMSLSTFFKEELVCDSTL